MAQFVLFELGYWLVGGVTKDADWVTVGTTQTRNRFIPNGKFDRYTQWAVREFQCHAKFPYAAKENVSSKEQLYMRRVFSATVADKPPQLKDAARYPENGKISGALNVATRRALQAWADGALRCPVIVYSSTDNKNKTTGNGTNLDLVLRENLWLHNDHPSTAPRMYAIDYSGYYTIPDAYKGQVNWEIAKDTKQGGEKIKYSFPKPIILGDYATWKDTKGNICTGPRSVPSNHTWASADVEVTPGNMLGKGGNNGAGLTDSELSTFKVVRTAAHFECYGYFDSVNAYDNVTISFGPCHWTLAWTCKGQEPPESAREMPAFLAYMKKNYALDYQKFFGNFGLDPAKEWPIRISNLGTYLSKISIQIETTEATKTTNEGYQVLCGVSGDESYRFEENKYGRNWHFYYRFQMACRTSTDLRRAMWDFTRIRIRDILNREFLINDKSIRVGDYIKSEKAVAMLLRWHIIMPAFVFCKPSSTKKRTKFNYLYDILNDAITKQSSLTGQALEDYILDELSSRGGPLTHGHLTLINEWTKVPQQGLVVDNRRIHYYYLNLDDPTLNSGIGDDVRFRLEEHGI